MHSCLLKGKEVFEVLKETESVRNAMSNKITKVYDRAFEKVYSTEFVNQYKARLIDNEISLEDAERQSKKWAIQLAVDAGERAVKKLLETKGLI